MGLFGKKNIAFWCVIDKDDESHFYTFTNTYAEASEYLMKLYVFKDRYEHFSQWCEFHNKDCNKLQDIAEYIMDLEVNLFDNYKINKIEYSPRNLASLFRIYNNCVPLDCSFETDFEQQNYLELVKQLQEAKEELGIEVE